MTETTVKSRAPNFSMQECMLLSQLMGEVCGGFQLSRHKVDKHRFNSKITSSTKKTLWLEVERQFNATSTSSHRSSTDLQKKWENLVAKQRAIYSDFKRSSTMTGGGPVQSSRYTVLTEAVMEVIGTEGVAVAGVSTIDLDTTFRQLQSTKNSSKDVVSDSVVTVECANESSQQQTSNTWTRSDVGCWQTQNTLKRTCTTQAVDHDETSSTGAYAMVVCPSVCSH